MHSLSAEISKRASVAGVEYMRQKAVRSILRSQIMWGLWFLSGVMWEMTGEF